MAHTVHARQILGPHAFLGVEHAVLFESDPDKARTIAREHLHPYLTSRFNFWGDLDTIAEKLHAHVQAGADHVGVQVIGIEPGRSAMPYWRMLGDALLPTASA